jgi:hypothetical protein
MSTGKAGISIEPVGIADILQRWRLAVPLNQRPYAWESDNVEKLFQDLNKAFGGPFYFLGAVMFTHGDKGRIEVADGQQRLATITILIAAIRDYLFELGDDKGAQQYESDFLVKYDPPSGSYKPQLTLNHQDHDFFHANILTRPADRKKPVAATLSSHERIAESANLAAAHVRTIAGSLNPTDRLSRLYSWVGHLKENAIVIVVNVPASVGNSFKMFETLNARGVPATQVDILKNYLFDRAPDQSARINAHWHSMISTIESYGDDGLIISFIRHLWVSQHGPTTVDELGGSFEQKIRNEQSAVDFVALLDRSAATYVALLAPLQSSHWEGLSTEARKAIDIISNEFGGEQIRPLMLAVSARFPKPELEAAFKVFLSWSVRFLIVGGGGGGKLDRYYGLRAKNVTDGTIKTASQLIDSMEEVVPGDVQFEEEFSRSSVKKSNLARYYLRAIEAYRAKDPTPQFLLNEDPNAVNLEHVLPVNPSAEWPIDRETAASMHKRIGNMILLPTRVNSTVGDKGFAMKKAEYAKVGGLQTTREVAEASDWGPAQIKERQARLAKDVAKVWSLKWK